MFRSAATLILVLWFDWCAPAAIGPAPKFLSRRDYYPAGFSTAVADVNRDGIPDLITSEGGVTVWVGDGHGGFRSLPPQSTGMEAASVFAVTDLNGDGKPDLLMVGQQIGSQQGVAVCFGNGDGTFQQAVFYQAGGEEGVGAAVLGDFNNDGIPDIAVVATSPGGSTNGVWLFTGKSAGAFNPGVQTQMIQFAGQMAAADFNGDGNLDLAITSITGFCVFFGNGNGTFQPSACFETRSAVGDLVAADVNMDGHADVAIGVGGSASPRGHVLLYLGDGKGGFSGPKYLREPGSAEFAIGDVNGDGIPDIVDALGYISFGQGNGTFKKPVYYPVSEGKFGPLNVVLADLRNNGRTDIVVNGGLGVSVLLNNGSGKFEDGQRLVVSGGNSDFGAAADYNGDGKADLAVPTATGVTILLGTGETDKPFSVGGKIALKGSYCPFVGDLNGDGIPDLLVPVINPKTGTAIIHAYLGKGDGTFVHTGHTAVSFLGWLAVGDFNHDGKTDFAVAGNLLALGKGDGTFHKPKPFFPNPPAHQLDDIVAGDFNGDGWPDLMLSGFDWPHVYVLLNDHHGGFKMHLDIPFKDFPYWMTLGDLNGDGALDLVVSSSAKGVFVYLGNGAGGFTMKDELTFSISQGVFTAIADLNGDDIPDLEVIQSNTIGIYVGNGDGTFATPLYVGGGPLPGLIFNESLHGQPPGFPDIVLPDASGYIWVLRNITKD